MIERAMMSPAMYDLALMEGSCFCQRGGDVTCGSIHGANQGKSWRSLVPRRIHILLLS